MKRLYIFSILMAVFTMLASAQTARLDSMLMYSGSEGSYTQSGVFKFYYNSNNQIIKEVLKGFDTPELPDGGGGFAVPLEMNLAPAATDTTFEIGYHYNDNGQIIEQYTILNFDANNDTVLKEELAYLEDGTLAGRAQFVYDPDMQQWMMFTTIEYAYENGNLISASSYFNVSPLPAMLYQKTEYSYNASGKILSEITYDITPFLNTETKSAKTEYEYNAGVLVAETDFTTTLDDEWLPDLRDEYTYDGNGIVIEIMSKEWDSTAEVWMDVDKSVLTIDYSISNPILILPQFFSDNANIDEMLTGVVTLVETFIEIDEAFAKSALVDVKTDYTELYWTIDGETQVEIVEGDTAPLYPNPNKGNFFITTEHYTKATVINLAGQVVYQQNLPAGTHTISLQNAEKGMYILQLDTDKTTVNQKFVVE